VKGRHRSQRDRGGQKPSAAYVATLGRGTADVWTNVVAAGVKNQTSGESGAGSSSPCRQSWTVVGLTGKEESPSCGG